MERMTKMVDLRESCMRKWERISERIMEQALVEAKTSAKTKQMIEDKKGIPGKTRVCTIWVKVHIFSFQNLSMLSDSCLFSYLTPELKQQLINSSNSLM